MQELNLCLAWYIVWNYLHFKFFHIRQLLWIIFEDKYMNVLRPVAYLAWFPFLKESISKFIPGIVFVRPFWEIMKFISSFCIEADGTINFNQSQRSVNCYRSEPLRVLDQLVYVRKLFGWAYDSLVLVKVNGATFSIIKIEERLKCHIIRFKDGLATLHLPLNYHFQLASQKWRKSLVKTLEQ